MSIVILAFSLAHCRHSYSTRCCALRRGRHEVCGISYSVVTCLVVYRPQNLSPRCLFPAGMFPLFVDALLRADIYCDRCPVAKLGMGGDSRLVGQDPLFPVDIINFQ